MSFGVGFGDAVAVLNIITNIRERLVEAPRQFGDIKAEVVTFSSVLQAVENPNLAGNLDGAVKKELKFLLDHSQESLKRLQDFLDGCQELSDKQQGLRKRLKRKWKQLNWDTKKLQEFRDLISACATKLNAFLANLNLKTTNETLKAMISNTDLQLETRKRDILKWLSPLDFGAVQRDVSDKRQAGTGQWFLTSSAYTDWATAVSARTLFCPGIPGSGKTHISSMVVDDMFARYEMDPGVGLSFVYFSYKIEDALLIPDVLRSILRQFSATQLVLPEQLRILYYKHLNRGTYPSLREVEALLSSVISIYRFVHIIIDAIDECSTVDTNRNGFVARLLSLQDQLDVKIFVTTRHIPEIERRFDISTRLEIRATQMDVRSFVEERLLRTDQDFIYDCPERQRLIVDDIVQASDGMFLLARFHVDSVLDETHWQGVEAVLRDISEKRTEAEALDAAYSTALSRVNSQGKGRRALATRVLGWITCLARPMTTRELQIGLAVEEGQEKIDEKRVSSITMILSACCGLVTVNQQNDEIQLAHYTTQSFLKNLGHDWLAEANSDLARTSLIYLRFQLPRTSINHVSSSVDDYGCSRCRGTGFTPCVFIPYASKFWCYHFRNNPDDVTRRLALDFLQDTTLLGYYTYHMQLCNLVTNQTWVGEAFVDSITFSSPHPMAFSLYGRFTVFRDKYDVHEVVRAIVPTSLPTALHLVGYLNCAEIFESLAVSSVGEIRGQWKGLQTPLMWAAYNNSLDVAAQLIYAGADIKEKDMFGWTALHYAAVKSTTAMIDMLLREGAEVDAFVEFPLVIQEATRVLENAVETGRDGENEVYTFFQDQSDTYMKDCEHNAQIPNDWRLDIEGSSPLYFSWYSTYTTPLDVAIYQNNQEAVTALLLGGANKNGAYSWNVPLTLAATTQCWDIVVKILESGADIFRKDYIGDIPLRLLVKNFGDDPRLWKALETIPEPGTNPDWQDFLNWQVIFDIVTRAIKDGDNAENEGLKFANRHDFNFLVTDTVCETVLHLAARHGDRACNVVKWLMEHGADVEARDHRGRTPLRLACGTCGGTTSRNLVQTFLEHGADINTQDDAGNTLLHATCAWWDPGDMVALLIENGADPRKPNHMGYTPAHRARRDGQYSTALILEREEERLNEKKQAPTSLTVR